MRELPNTFSLTASSLELRLIIESQIVKRLTRERDEAHTHLMHVQALLEEAERELTGLVEAAADSVAA